MEHAQSVPLIIPRHMRKHAEPFDKLSTVVGEDPAVGGATAVVSVHSVESKILGIDVKRPHPIRALDSSVRVLLVAGDLCKEC